jgi:hypothetical protein
MCLWSNINGKLYPATNTAMHLRSGSCRVLAVSLFAVVLIVACGATAWAQEPDTQPMKETVTATQTTDSVSDQSDAEIQDAGIENKEVSVSAPPVIDRLPVLTKQTKSPAPAKQSQSKTASGQPKKEKRGSLIIAPIPISSPAVGSGLVLALGYVFKFDKNDKLSPPSTVGLVGAFTNSGTRGGGIGAKLYLKENTYQTTFILAKGRVNFDFFDIGRIPGREPISVAIKGAGTVFYGDFLRNVGDNIFVGVRFQYRRISTTLDGPQTPGGFEIPAIDLKSTSAALGFRVQRDKRDNTFYPKKGTLIDVTGDFFDQIWGSRREYQTYKFQFNGYREVSPRGVIAYRAMACTANGSVPFYDLCLFGANNDLRGYTAGEFQNRRMFATQMEYRMELPRRLGLVAFGGIGGIAGRWNAFRADELLPAAGVGLRFKLDKKNHINYRIDFAVGRDGHTLSIGVGEAF